MNGFDPKTTDPSWFFHNIMGEFRAANSEAIKEKKFIVTTETSDGAITPWTVSAETHDQARAKVSRDFRNLVSKNIDWIRIISVKKV